MMACFDERGRLFIAESDGRNLQKNELLREEPRFVRMLEDLDGDGTFDRSALFADRMVMPEGALWHDGSLFVVSAPFLWRLEDADGDGVAEKREKLVGEMEFDGRPNQHGPYLGPEGRFYFSGGHFGYDLAGRDGRRTGRSNAAGIFSCRPDGTDVEVLGHAGINPVEVAFSEEGEIFSTCAIFDSAGGRHDALIHWIRGGTYGPSAYGPSLLPSTGHRLGAARRWGQVAPSGLARYRGAAFGDEYRDNLFACFFNTRRAVRIRLERHGSTFRAQEEDFLVSESRDFHPADVLEDADGSLLVIDTGGWLSWGCPFSQIAKPEIRGGIYRVRKTGAPIVDDPRGLRLDWTRVPAARLDDPRPAVRDRAIAALAREGDRSVASLREALRSDPSARLRRNAAWALSRIATPEASGILREALADRDATVRQAAMAGAGASRDAEAIPALARAVVDEPPHLRRAAAAALGRIGGAAAAPALLRSLSRVEDEHLSHALIYALIEIADREATLPGLRDPSPSVRRGALIALDRMKGGQLAREEVIPHLDPANPALREAAFGIITSRPGWAGELVGFVREGLERAPADERGREELQGALLAFSGDPAVRDLVARTLRNAGTPAATRLLLLETLSRAPLDRLPAIWLAELRWALEDGDERVARQSVATLRGAGAPDFDEVLLALGRDGGKSADLRAEALAAAAPRLSRMEGTLLGFLASCLEKERPALLRLTAAQALGSARLDDGQLKGLLPLLSRLGPLELPKVLGAYARSKDPGVGNGLAATLEKSPAVESLSPESLRQAFQGYPPEIQAKARPILRRLEADVEQQKERLSGLDRSLKAGDPARGRAVFFGEKAACAGCHPIEGRGARVGPDLSRIGQIRSRRDLLEAIVYPSATLVNGYETHVVRTKDGGIHDGLIARQTAEAIYLHTAERGERRIPRASVEEIRQSRLSIMPQGLEGQLGPGELSDLLAFLESLK
jgi:putative membrane-bound dehydrogenase-like protein